MVDKKTESAEAQVADAVEKENEKGFRGVKADETPNHAYTVAGVTAGEPTPETNSDK